jgi:selenophosphate synthetase-related protein
LESACAIKELCQEHGVPTARIGEVIDHGEIEVNGLFSLPLIARAGVSENNITDGSPSGRLTDTPRPPCRQLSTSRAIVSLCGNGYREFKELCQEHGVPTARIGEVIDHRRFTLGQTHRHAKTPL